MGRTSVWDGSPVRMRTSNSLLYGTKDDIRILDYINPGICKCR